MPRPLRIEYVDAWYHVMNRGANHQTIFTNDDYRNMFLSLLGEIKNKFYVETHAYCLMDNHYHLLLHTPIANLSKGMRHLDGLYTQRFNRIKKRDGSLFRGRYKAILIDKDSHLLAVSRYIHLNPVTANICNSPIEYPWSSYQDYMGKKKKNLWLNIDFILKMIYEHKKTYDEFINEGNSEEITKFYSKKHLSSILGEKKFIDDTLSKLSQEKLYSSLHDINRTKIVVAPEIILHHVLNYFQTTFEDAKKSFRGKINLPKMIGILLLRQLGQLSHSTIAEYFGCSNDNIATTLKRIKNLIQQDVDLENQIKKLICFILE